MLQQNYSRHMTLLKGLAQFQSYNWLVNKLKLLQKLLISLQL